MINLECQMKSHSKYSMNIFQFSHGILFQIDQRVLIWAAEVEDGQADEATYGPIWNMSQGDISMVNNKLKNFKNINYFRASVDDDIQLTASQDFGYSLGVLHHIPDTQAALSSCVKLLKPGAPFLVYLYYSFDNRSKLYRFIWKVSDLIRRLIFILPSFLKHWLTDCIAILIYYPLTRIALAAERCGIDISNIPLSYYKDHSLYTMRTDARDRFGTPLEQRFSKEKIHNMMLEAGLDEIKFSSNAPFWCAVGYKK